MTYRVVTGQNAVPFTSQHKAVAAYTAAVVAYPHEHITLIEGDELPGIPPKILAQRFGIEPPPDEQIHIIP